MSKLTPYELLLEIRSNYSETETIQIANELIEEIEDDPKKYILNFSNCVDDFANDNNLCPLCGSEIIVKSYKESRGEYFGFLAEENEYQTECSNPECPHVE